MSIKNKGFVLLETIIVMSVLLIGMILLYSNYNRIFMNSGKISYYDNVEDMYTAYYASKLYLTEIDASDKEADTYFPEFDKSNYSKIILDKNEENGIKYTHVLYKRKN